MIVTDMTLFKMQAARIKLPAGGTKTFVAGRAQSGSPQDDEPEQDRTGGATCTQVLAVLSASQELMTASAVARALHTSAGQASQALKYLAAAGKVLRHGTPGKRGAVYGLP